MVPPSLTLPPSINLPPRYRKADPLWRIVSAGAPPYLSGGYTTVLSGLEMNQYYEVQARTRVGDEASEWSDSVFVYTTHEPVPDRPDMIVGPVKVAGFLDSNAGNATHPSSGLGNYSFVICAEDYLRNDNRGQKLLNQIQYGIQIWGYSTGGIIGGIHHRNPNGSLRNCDDSDGDHLRNKVRLKGKHTIRRECLKKSANLDDAIDAGCAQYSISNYGFRAANVYLYEDTSIELNGKNCSRMRRLAMHEAGHVFGLHDFGLMPGESVMNMPEDNLCVPTAHDIAAINAIYQSRPPNTSRSLLSSSTPATTPTTTTVPSPPTATPTKAPTTTATVTATTAPAGTTTTTTTVSITTALTTTITTTPTTTTTTTSGAQPVAVWQIETRPSYFNTKSGDINFQFTSGNTFTYAGRSYTMDMIKVYRRGPRLRATPDIEDYELPDNTLLRFWPTDTPTSVQTIRLSDANRMPASSAWDLLWPRSRYPINIDRNTTWHIELTIPASTSSTSTTTASSTTTTSTSAN